MQLVYYPDPVLRKPAEPLASIDDEVREKVRQMFEVMYAERGVGLAAPQVGWSARLFIMNTAGDPEEGEERVYINPEIVEAQGESVDEEGCLSIPEVRGKVLRKNVLRVQASDVDGLAFEQTIDGLAARAFQHEKDHIDGILFISRLSVSGRLRVSRELKKLEKAYRKNGAGVDR